MKLDKRISNDLRDVYTLYCRNNDNLLGFEVYASNDIDDFNDIDQCKKGKIDYIDPVHGYSVKIDSENTCFFNFVIPTSAVKPKEKKYRPYTFMEFTDIFTVGRPIKFRKKGEVGCERYLILNGYSHNQILGETTTDIYIGRGAYTLDELFSKYEWQEHYTKDFEPFGVEVEE